MNTNILSVDHLHKHYGNIHALNDFSLQVQKGQIWGILGPNGSGKSTFLGVILYSVLQNSGSYSWFDNEYGILHRRRIGSLLENPNFYPHLNSIDNLKIIAKIKNIQNPKINDALNLVNLYNRRKSAFKTFSLGMKQRLGIAATLIGDPEVLVLDEPTNGLDPVGIAEIRDLIIELGKMSKTIIMASHILPEVEKVCSHVAILKSGKLLATGEIGHLLSPRKKVILKSSHEALYDVLHIYPQIKNLSKDDEYHFFEVEPGFPLKELYAYISSKGILLTGIKEEDYSLEEEFLKITNN